MKESPLSQPNHAGASITAPGTTPPKTAARARKADPKDRAILDAIEEEELNLALELHDTVCQSLSGLRLTAAALRRKFPEVQGIATDDFVHLERVAARVAGELQEIVKALQPVELAAPELSFALEDLAREMRPLIHCDYRCIGRPAVTDGFVASQVLRIVRALVRHAIATKSSKHLTIVWAQGSNDSKVTVTADQPTFAELEAFPARWLSWKSALRRVAAIGAEIAVEHGGTTLALRLPVAAQSSQ